MNALLELAERCEAATGPDSGLDVEIALTVFERRYPAPHLSKFTASLDAAMTLVPEGCCVDMRRFDGGAEGFTQVRSTDATPDDADDELYVESDHCATLALAICAAALRARASQESAK